MNSTNIYDYLEKSDLSGSLRQLSDLIGLNNVKLIIRHFSGEHIYVPNIHKFKSVQLKLLLSHSDKSLKQQASILKVAPLTVQTLLGEKPRVYKKKGIVNTQR